MSSFNHRHTIRFRESVDKKGKIWDVVLIEAGQSINGAFYPADVLRASIPLFEGAKACAYKLGNVFDHVPDALFGIEQKLVGNIVGFFDNVSYGAFTRPDGTTGEGLLAKFNIFDSAEWLQSMLRESFSAGHPGLLGLSINALGESHWGVVNGVHLKIADRIRQVDSTDVVDAPAAGGGMIRMVASVNNQMPLLGEKLKMFRPEWFAGFEEFREPENLIDSVLETAGLKAQILEGQTEDVAEKVGFQQMGRLISALREKVAAGDEGAAVVLAEVLAPNPAGSGLANVSPWVYNGGISNFEDLTMLTPEQIADFEAKQAQFEKDKAAFDAMKNEMAMKEASLLVKERVGASGLPEIICTKMLASLTRAGITAAEIDAEIAAQREVVAKIKESVTSVKTTGLGGSHDPATGVTVGDSMREKFGKAFDGFWNGGISVDNVPAFGSMHEAFSKITGKWDSPAKMARGIMTGIQLSMPHVEGEDFNEHMDKLAGMGATSIPERFRESITTTDFPILFGQSMNRRLQKEYTSDPFSDWRQIVSSIENLRDATNTFNLPRVGGQTILPIVNQNAPYQEGTDPTEVNEQLTPHKRGRILKITWEDMLADNVGVLRRIPKILANSTNRTIQQLVFAEIEENRIMSDSVALIDAAHANLVTGSPALTYANFALAVRLLREQTEQNSGERLGLIPWRLLVGPKLEEIATTIMASKTGRVGSTNENETVTNANAIWGVSAMSSIALGLSASTDDHWYLIASPQHAETISVGFLGGKDKPDIFVQGVDSPVSGSFFDADAITFKVRLVCGARVIDHRWIAGSLA